MRLAEKVNKNVEAVRTLVGCILSIILEKKF